MATIPNPKNNGHCMYNDAPQTTVRKYAEITPSDDTILDMWARAIRVGTAGDVKVTDIRGNDVTFVGVLAGETLPIWVSKVKATGTTASDIVGYFG